MHLNPNKLQIMDTPFIYDTYVTGKNFIGRKTECNMLGNLLDKHENVVIYEPPKAGKKSLIQQTLFNMRISGRQFTICQVNLFNIRSKELFLTRFGSAVIRACYSTPAEYADVAGRLLAGSHFVFDKERFARSDEVVSLNWELDRNDMHTMLSLPARIAEEKDSRMFVIIEEFQNLMMDDGYSTLFEVLKEVLEANRGMQGQGCSFILTGSRVNAMKYIFENYKYFHRLVEHLPLLNVDQRDIIDHIMKGFQLSGKVIEQDLILGAYKLFRGNLWYLNNFVAICDSLTKGYINEGILMEALRMMLSSHEPRFMRIMYSLTEHQVSLLRAIIDGVVKFSATDVIEKYSLNSSANVRRVKDALCKKEIVTFNDREEPVILDPLFEYWLGRHYFEIPGI